MNKKNNFFIFDNNDPKNEKRIIGSPSLPYVMTWDGVMTSYHKKNIQELDVQPTLKAYIRSVVLKKTLESIFLDRRRELDQEEAG
jgi:hypothetical protein